MHDNKLHDKIRAQINDWPDYKKEAYNEQFATTKYVKKLSLQKENRLSFRFNHEVCYTGDNGKSTVLCSEMLVEQIRECMEKLAAYEDLEEKNLLLKLPCNIGDPVWFITRTFNVKNENTTESIERYTVTQIRGNKFNPLWYLSADAEGNIRDFHPTEIGRTVFVNVLEAAKKLEERNG